MRTSLHCLPKVMADTVTHAVWHYTVCRSVACISRRRSVATQTVAHTVFVSELRRLLMRLVGQRSSGRLFCGWRCALGGSASVDWQCWQ